MEITADQILDQAADEILVRGWCQGRLQDPEGRVCLQGAVRRAAEKLYNALPWTFTTPEGREWGKAHAVMRDLVAIRGYVTPSAWNDAEGRTIDDIIEFLRFGAKHIREDSQCAGSS